MVLIILSILSGYFCMFVAGALELPEFMLYAFGLIGFFSPGLYTLEKVSKEIREIKKENI